MAIDYSIFGNKEDIENGMSTYMQELRDSNKAKGQDRIWTHGEKELSNYENVRRRAEGQPEDIRRAGWDMQKAVQTKLTILDNQTTTAPFAGQ